MKSPEQSTSLESTKAAKPRLDQERPDKETFSLSDAATHDLVERYEPKFMAKGGDQLVYEVPGRPKIVAKASYPLMRRIQEKSDPTTGELTLEGAEAVEEFLKTNRERFSNLRKAFGDDHVVPMKQYLMKVPVTPEIIDWLHEGNPPAHAARAKEALTLMTIQKKLDYFDDPENLSIVSGYLENKEPDPEAYRRVNRAFAGDGEGKEEALKEFARIGLREQRELLAKMGEDPALAAEVRDFVSKAVKFSETTGESLDLAGKGNVIISKQGGAWKVELIDALYPTRNMPDKFTRAKAHVAKALKGETLDEGEKNEALNAINYVRVINLLGYKAGAPESLRLLPDGAEELDLLKLLKED